jgi:hypothetical protein
MMSGWAGHIEPSRGTRQVIYAMPKLKNQQRTNNNKFRHQAVEQGNLLIRLVKWGQPPLRSNQPTTPWWGPERSLSIPGGRR